MSRVGERRLSPRTAGVRAHRRHRHLGALDPLLALSASGRGLPSVGASSSAGPATLPAVTASATRAAATIAAVRLERNDAAAAAPASLASRAARAASASLAALAATPAVASAVPSLASAAAAGVAARAVPSAAVPPAPEPPPYFGPASPPPEVIYVPESERVREPVLACVPGQADPSLCSYVPVVFKAAAACAGTCILAVLLYLVVTAARLCVHKWGSPAMLASFACCISLMHVQAGLVLLAIAHLCEVYLGQLRDHYQVANGVTAQTADATVWLYGGFDFIRAASYLGLVAAVCSLIDGCVRVGRLRADNDDDGVQRFPSATSAAEPYFVSSAGGDCGGCAGAPAAGGQSTDAVTAGRSSSRLMMPKFRSKSSRAKTAVTGPPQPQQAHSLGADVPGSDNPFCVNAGGRL